MKTYELTLTAEQIQDIRFSIEDTMILAEKSKRDLKDRKPEYIKKLDDRIARLDNILVQILK